MAQYQDWPFNGNDEKWRARCPELDKNRRLWLDGKAKWKAMSGKEQRASKDAGPSGLWAMSRVWRERGEAAKRACMDDYREERGPWYANLLPAPAPVTPMLTSAPMLPPPSPSAASGPSPVLIGVAALGAVAAIGTVFWIATR